MVEISIKVPEDLKWITEESNLKLVEDLIIRKLLEFRLGDVVAGETTLCPEEIDRLDHIIKRNLYWRIKKSP